MLFKHCARIKTRSLLLIIAVFLTTAVFSQKSSLELSFAALDSISYVKLDSVKVMNRTQGGESIFYWPDTNIIMDISVGDTLIYVGYATFFPVGIQDNIPGEENFKIFQNYPNPVLEKSVVSVYIPKKGLLSIMVSDLQGRIILSNEFQVEGGRQDFRFVPGAGNLFFFTASWNGHAESIKILSSGQQTGQCCIEHIGSSHETISHKEASQQKYSYIKESGIIDAPTENKSYTFQFMDKGPCPGTPTVNYGGQIYNTVQIFSQCWLKENLNIGSMIQVNEEMTDDGTIEKYCYDNHIDSCAEYGGLYQWNELMEYSTLQGSKGICPSGWHVPTDEEWKILEGAVDSQYSFGDPEWDKSKVYRGFDVGYKLKTTEGWQDNGNGSDQFGFSGKPGGARGYDGGVYLFVGKSNYSYWWTSSELNQYSKWSRNLGYPSSGSIRMPSSKEYGYAVRCLKDN